MSKVIEIALLVVCLALMVGSLLGCWWAARTDDWVSFATLSVCAAVSGYMAGAALAWVRFGR